ncbi:hypothetical protein GOP47_0005931 [Adiantum capillus-veneris]|uniref:Cilia- and flagella-associated protein 206 n=1 Tax=Adiantum capillus-veneris TaxID=13818 RepID=A0A9D4V2H9_ADICA|nr:hypothetical protein GOP47_0005931 [Adiantum capillus-veneris]
MLHRCSIGAASKGVVDRCSKLLALEDCPALETIQLQVSAHAHMFMQQMILAREERASMKKRDDILRSILNIQVLDRREANLAADKLHDLVVDFIMETINRTDDEFKIDVLHKDEINSSLDSFFPRAGFLYWINQSDVEKASQLQELSNIILGIGVYNRARDNIGNANDPIYSSFENGAKAMEKNVKNEVNTVLERGAAYRKVIDMHIHSLGIHHVLVQRLRDELHYDLQLFSLLQDLQCVLTEMHSTMSKLLKRLQELLQILFATIGSETCVPNELVFPDFRNIGLLQKRALTELRKFMAQSRVAEELLALSTKPGYKRTPLGLAALKTDRGVSKIQIMADNCNFLPPDIFTTTSCEVERLDTSNVSYGNPENIVIIDGKEVSSTKNTKLHLNGFCPMTIVCHGGLLLLGDLKAGLVQIGDKAYSFATTCHFKEFAKSPIHYLRALEKMVIAMPQLINMLGLQTEPKFAQLAIPNNSTPKERSLIIEVSTRSLGTTAASSFPKSKILDVVNKKPLQHDFATQTSTHIQTEHEFDRDTLFLRMKELENKQTHSTQTCNSHFYRDSCSQVWLPRDKSTQSLFGKGTTMPIKLKFFENLRGPPHFKFNPVDILLDV